MANPGELVLSHLTPVSEPNVTAIKNITAIKKIVRDQVYTGKISEALDLKVYNTGMDDGQKTRGSTGHRSRSDSVRQRCGPDRAVG